MVICAVKGCKTRSDNSRALGLSLFRIPKIRQHHGDRDRIITERRRHQFMANINRKIKSESAIDNLRICSIHFLSGKPAHFRDETNVDWAPTLLLGHDKINTKKVILSNERHERRKKRKIRQEERNAAEALLNLCHVHEISSGNSNDLQQKIEVAESL